MPKLWYGNKEYELFSIFAHSNSKHLYKYENFKYYPYRHFYDSGCSHDNYYKDELTMNTSNSNDEKLYNVNKFYSGYYFVDGYKIYYTQNNANDNMLSNFKTELILKRREWPVPVDYEKE